VLAGALVGNGFAGALFTVEAMAGTAAEIPETDIMISCNELANTPNRLLSAITQQTLGFNCNANSQPAARRRKVNVQARILGEVPALVLAMHAINLPRTVNDRRASTVVEYPKVTELTLSTPAVTHDRLPSGREFFAGSPALGRVSQFKQSSD
jgi:hypothetical protein